MTNFTFAERAAALEARIHRHIPLARAMCVRVVAYDGERVTLTAPLQENLNDKGTGFAGSLATLVTLAGWSLATLVGESGVAESGVAEASVAEAGVGEEGGFGETCEAAVYHSELDFLRPVREELRAEAWVTDATAVARLHERLAAGKRAKLPVSARLGPAEDPAVIFSGNYAVWRAGTQSF